MNHYTMDAPSTTQLALWDEAITACAQLRTARDFIKEHHQEFSWDSRFRDACFVGCCRSGNAILVQSLLACVRIIQASPELVCDSQREAEPRGLPYVTDRASISRHVVLKEIYRAFARAGEALIDLLLADEWNWRDGEIDYVHCLNQAIIWNNVRATNWFVNHIRIPFADLCDAIVLASSKTEIDIMAMLLSSPQMENAKETSLRHRETCFQLCVKRICMQACIRGDIQSWQFIAHYVAIDHATLRDCLNAARLNSNYELASIIERSSFGQNPNQKRHGVQGNDRVPLRHSDLARESFLT